MNSGRGSAIRHSATVDDDLLYVAVPIRRGGRLLGVSRVARSDRARGAGRGPAAPGDRLRARHRPADHRGPGPRALRLAGGAPARHHGLRAAVRRRGPRGALARGARRRDRRAGRDPQRLRGPAPGPAGRAGAGARAGGRHPVLHGGRAAGRGPPRRGAAGQREPLPRPRAPRPGGPPLHGGGAPPRGGGAGGGGAAHRPAAGGGGRPPPPPAASTRSPPAPSPAWRARRTAGW